MAPSWRNFGIKDFGKGGTEWKNTFFCPGLQSWEELRSLNTYHYKFFTTTTETSQNQSPLIIHYP